MIILPRSSLTSFLLLVILSIGLTACDCPSCDTPAQAVWPYYKMAPTPPPEPLAENVPIPDDPSAYLWRPGYWTYNGTSFDWIPGEMMLRPSATAVWSQDHWIEHTYGWAYMPGYWQ